MIYNFLISSIDFVIFYNTEGENFSHILSYQKSPQDILSVTIISDSILKSGIFSTSFIIDTNIRILEGLKVILDD